MTNDQLFRTEPFPVTVEFVDPALPNAEELITQLELVDGVQPIVDTLRGPAGWPEVRLVGTPDRILAQLGVWEFDEELAADVLRRAEEIR